MDSKHTYVYDSFNRCKCKKGADCDENQEEGHNLAWRWGLDQESLTHRSDTYVLRPVLVPS